MTYFWGFLLLLLQLHTVAAQIVPYLIPDFVPQPPLPPPAYMVDNTGNTHGSAPDHSAVNGPAVDIEFVAEVGNTTLLEKRASPSFWVGGVTHGRSPYVTTSGYKIYRNVKVGQLMVAHLLERYHEDSNPLVARTMEPKETALPTTPKR